MLLCELLNIHILYVFYKLNFPNWIIAISSAVLVFVFLFVLVDSTNRTKGMLSGNFENVLSTTIIINIVLAVLMIIVVMFTKLIFKKDEIHTSFVFLKPQIIAIAIYTILNLLLLLIPLVNSSAEIYDDLSSEKYRSKIQRIVESNDTLAFRNELSNSFLLNRFKYSNISSELLIEILVVKDKVDLIDIVYKYDKSEIEHYHNFDIQSTQMIDVLAQNNVNINDIILALVRHNKKYFIKYTVDKYNPSFSINSELIFNEILKQNDSTFLNYMMQNGLQKSKMIH